jgi:serine/threonine protein kinase
MSNKLGHFEILSELAKSPTGSVYKANDPENGQTIALKAIQLSAFGEAAHSLEEALVAEAESTKVFSSSNITSVFGAGEIEGQFCVAMEYVQGNSIATMLARNEGFSIWDLLDIGRQLCNGLDHAASHNIMHYSLEPAKIMCGWDGTVKILGYGVSSAGNFVQYITEGLPESMHYMSPEQIMGQPMDGRSNLFTLGAMFYEMVTERKAFDRDDAENLRQSILSSTPVAPVHVNPKIHPVLSDLIMKLLAKDPAERYQTGRAVLDDLEKCKESRPLAGKPAAPKGTTAPAKANAAAQSKFIAGAKAAPAKPSAPAASKSAAPQKPPTAPKPAPPKPVQKKIEAPASPETFARGEENPASTFSAPKAAAAAAGVGSAKVQPASALQADQSISENEIPEIDLSDQFITASVKATITSAEPPSASMSSAVADELAEEPQVETFEPSADAPRIAVDPMMAEGGASASTGTSFSEISELPPLKEIYIAPPPPPPVFEPEEPKKPTSTAFKGDLKRADDKPKVQTREVAEKALKEISSVPPKLYGYAIGAAVVVILAIGIGVTYYVHSQNSDEDNGAPRQSAPEQAPTMSAKQESKPAPVAQTSQQTAEAEPAPVEPVETTKAKTTHKRAPAPPPKPVIIPGSLAIDSTPQGAQVQLDGKSDPSWVTPLTLNNMMPGQHSITVIKPGYSTDTRPVDVTAANRATIVVHLAQLVATLVVKSDPVGANIYVDGRDSGAKTPGQVSVDKGQHTILVRKAGYLDETMSTQFVLGQTFNFSPTLRPLGNIDSMHTVGKMSKLFGGKGAQAGQATVSIRTQPKGAQVAINQHLMEKNSPMDVALDPGNYVIDITMTGYAPVHKVVTAQQGEKLVVDEVLQPQ